MKTLHRLLMAGTVLSGVAMIQLENARAAVDATTGVATVARALAQPDASDRLIIR